MGAEFWARKQPFEFWRAGELASDFLTQFRTCSIISCASACLVRVRARTFAPVASVLSLIQGNIRWTDFPVSQTIQLGQQSLGGSMETIAVTCSGRFQAGAPPGRFRSRPFCRVGRRPAGTLATAVKAIPDRGKIGVTLASRKCDRLAIGSGVYRGQGPACAALTSVKLWTNPGSRYGGRFKLAVGAIECGRFCISCGPRFSAAFFS